MSENIKKQKILVVDDNPNDILVVESILKLKGFDIIQATSCQECLLMSKNDIPDLILLDMLMLKIGEHIDYQRLQEFLTTQLIPIIFIIANDDKKSINESFNLGAVDYITKPLNKAELLARITTHVKLKIINNDLINTKINSEKLVSKRTLELQNANAQLQDEMFRRKKAEEQLKSLNNKLENTVKTKILELNKEQSERKNIEVTLSETKNKYDGLVDLLPQIVFEADLDGNILFVNKRSLGIFGYTQEEVKSGINIIEVIAQKDKERAIKNFTEQIAGNENNSYEYTVLKKDGTSLPVVAYSSLIYKNNKPIGISGIVIDVSEKEIVTEALKKTAFRLEAVIEAVGEGVTLSDQNGSFEIFNSEMSKITGYTMKEANSYNYFIDILYPDANERAKAFLNLNKLNSKGDSINIDTTITDKFGNKKTLLVSSVLMKFKNKSHYLSVYKDITKRKKNQEKLALSQKRYSLATKAAKTGVWDWNILTNEFYFDSIVKNILGYSDIEISNNIESWKKLVYSYDLKKLQRNVFKFIKGNDNECNVEVRMIHKNGSTIWLLIKGKVLRDSDRNAVRMIGTNSDITELKNAHIKIEEQYFRIQKQNEELNTAIEQFSQINDYLVKVARDLKDSEKRYRTLATNIPDTDVFIYDKDLRFIVAEGGEMKNFGLSQKHFEGKTLSQAYEPEIVSCLTPLFLAALNGKNASSIIKINEWWFLYHTVPLKNDEGKLYGGLAVSQNITETKHKEIELKKAKEEAELANNAKSEFLANMSHEIRTPLNAIIGFASILKEKFVKNVEYLNYLDGINNGGKNLLALINDILDLSKIEAGRLEIQNEIINPISLLNEIKQIFSIRTSQKQIYLNVNVQSKLFKGLLIDEIRLRQILFNLVGNAIKFTHKGGVTVYMSTENKDSQDRDSQDKYVDLILKVKDTGIGIEREQQELIFKPFMQKIGQRTSKYGGTGLGLSITKRLVEMMNGKITLESNVNEGSCFTVYFYNIKIASYKEIENKIPECKSYDIKFKSSKLLMVEDIDVNRQVIREYLANQDIQIVEATNGLEAIEIVKKEKFDLILMDIKLPDIDGIETINRIRNIDEFKNIPIIILSATCYQEKLNKIKDICNDFLQKPIDKNCLINALKTYLPYIQEHIPLDTEHVSEDLKCYVKAIHETINERKKLNSIQKNQIRQKISPLYINVQRKMSINNIKDFAVEIENIGGNFEIPSLCQYGEELLQQTNIFNFEKIIELLDLFPEMIKIFST